MSWNDGSESEQQQSRGYQGTSNEDDLLVFGYGCKIFRDDAKAQWIDLGKHLIPWMGDTECGVTIDRYDGRGALMDLRSHETPSGGANFTAGLSPEELEIERLCEIERYRDFDENSEYDETAYQEEEYKRLQRAVDGMSGGDGREYGSVGYSYNDAPVEMGPEPRKISGEAPYVQPTDLVVPPNILLPTTMKSHAIIEKTAKFIAGHGTQMEIILKTKQANNLQFNFLSHGDELNPYYKHLVEAIKTNAYKPPDESQYAEESDSADGSSDEEGGYLHPSLLAPKAPSKPAISDLLSKANFKPSSNCAYSMLVSKLKVESESKDQEGQKASVDQSKNLNEPAMPSSQDQMIIDKMAAYVVKNGTDFETMARTRGDPRFAFLHPQHQYYWYYVECKNKCQVQKEAVVASKSFVSYITPPSTVQASAVLSPPPSNTSISNATSTSKSTATQSDAFKNAVKAINEMVQTNGHSGPRAALSLQASKSTGVNRTSINEDVPSPKEVDEEEEKRLKEERRKRAALFLQKVKKSQFLQSQAAKSRIIPKPLELPTESDDELQVIACTASIADRVGSDVSSKVAILPSKELQKRLNPFTFSYKTTALPIKEESQIPASYLKEGRSRSSPSRRSQSSSRSSSSDTHSSRSPSPHRSRRKKSKRKHSKKSHKRRDRSRSRSSSESRSSRVKKSKKRRR